jgi:hypothetical protein
MRNTETGEFELVVGNRQLLSGFFIVVLLFAVAFAMGYVVGQNSPRTAKLQAEAGSSTSAQTADARPQPTPPPVPVASPENPPARSSGEGPQPATQAPPQPTTHAARDGGAPVVAAAAPPAPLESAPGTYWQVMAVPQPDAEVVVRTLKDKGFPAMLTQGPNNLMRVLVGPFSDTQTMGKAKTDLENAGFHPIRK